MKAIVRDEYGPPDVLELQEIVRPDVESTDVLVRVRAASVNTADLDYLLGRPPVARAGTGMRKPRNRQLGLDVAGQIESVGRDVTRLQPGDKVFGDLTEFGYGAFAEFAVASESAFAPMPAGLSFEQAATVPQAGVMAVQALLGKGPIRAGDRVLINGASGGVGPFAVQIAKALGAEVTGVASTAKLELVKSVGADHIVDYRVEDYTQGRGRYDLIVDIAAHRSIFDVRRVMSARSRYVWTGGSLGRLLQTTLVGGPMSIVGGKKIGMLMWKPFKAEDVATIAGLLESGKVVPVIDRTYPLDEVPEALRYQDAGKAQGKLIIVM